MNKLGIRVSIKNNKNNSGSIVLIIKIWIS